jgi:excisionase family DNA binding protein
MAQLIGILGMEEMVIGTEIYCCGRNGLIYQYIPSSRKVNRRSPFYTKNEVSAISEPQTYVCIPNDIMDHEQENPTELAKWSEKLPGFANLMTLDEVCTLLRMSAQAVKRLCRNRQIPCIKISKFWRFSREELTTWLKYQK